MIKYIIVILLLFGSYVVRDLHTMASPTREMSYPFFHGYDLADGTHWNGVVKEDRWVYDVCEHISNIMHMTVIRVLCALPLFNAMLTLEIIDGIDYVLRYSYDWGDIYGVKIDYDIIKNILTFIFCITQLWTLRRYIGSSE